MEDKIDSHTNAEWRRLEEFFSCSSVNVRIDFERFFDGFVSSKETFFLHQNNEDDSFVPGVIFPKADGDVNQSGDKNGYRPAVGFANDDDRLEKGYVDGLFGPPVVVEDV